MESFYKKKKKAILWPQAKPTESELSFQKFLQSFFIFFFSKGLCDEGLKDRKWFGRTLPFWQWL